MMIHEFAERSKKHGNISNEDYAKIEPLYIVLDLDKDQFAALVDAVGLERLTAKAGRWTRFLKAEEELAGKERYIAAKDELENITRRQAELQASIAKYEHDVRVYC
jgi:hypothetical protein